MSIIKFAMLSIAYLIAAYFVWLSIILSCGLGPDSPEACNLKADFRASIFPGIALIVYGILGLLFMRSRRKG